MGQIKMELCALRNLWMSLTPFYFSLNSKMTQQNRFVYISWWGESQDMG